MKTVADLIGTLLLTAGSNLPIIIARRSTDENSDKMQDPAQVVIHDHIWADKPRA